MFFVAGFLALGVWQLERRVEKLALIDRVESRVNAPPVSPPDRADWPQVTASRDEYRHVRISGHFAHDRETLVQAVTEAGAGSWVLTPLVSDAGFTVLVNRGFVPPDRRDPATRIAGQAAGEVVVTGLLRISEPRGGFLRSNDPAGNRWYSRDVEAIAAARALSNVAPYFIDADVTPNAGGWPLGGLTVIRFSNNHLVYALTWFALGIGLGIGAFRVLRSR
jgi:surfeit locus 1 family protein